MEIECTKSNQSLKRNRRESNEKLTMHLEENRNFLSGIINLNPLLINKVEKRMPKYMFKRFANACDLINTFQMIKKDLNIKKNLNTYLDSCHLKDLANSQECKDKYIDWLIKSVKTRVHQSLKKPKRSNLSFCSPWLSKEKPKSAKECDKSIMKGKIYTSVSARHSNSDDFVVVQETESQIGYMPAVFIAKATVAFPPICKGEVWTIGWIQAMTKADKFIYYDQNITSVFP